MYKYYISRWGIYYIFSTTAPYVSLHNHWATTKKQSRKMTSIGEDVEGGARPLRTIGGNVSVSRAGCCGKTVKKFLKHLKIESSLTQNFRF